MNTETTDDIFEKYDLLDVDERFPIPEMPSDGLILICGSSGSGKSSILRHHFGSEEIVFDEEPIYKNFTSPLEAERLLIACGLRSIPTWKRSINQLSNGEQHRAYCAKAIDSGSEFIDEFTSVVDRNTAKALSYSMQKHFRSSPKIKRLVIATCHRDVIDWLNPDYLYDTDLKSWDDLRKRGCLRRPRISLRIRSEEDGENLWSIFKRHHYLSSSYNKSANAFAAEIDGQIVGMSSILRFPNGNFKNGWREHRTVILPEFQGLGIGTALSETIADMVLSSGGRFFSKTSHPAFGAHRDKSIKWRGTSKNHQSRGDYNKNRKTKEDGHKMLHANRVCYSHEYIGNLENN